MFSLALYPSLFMLSVRSTGVVSAEARVCDAKPSRYPAHEESWDLSRFFLRNLLTGSKTRDTRKRR